MDLPVDLFRPDFQHGPIPYFYRSTSDLEKGLRHFIHRGMEHRQKILCLPPQAELQAQFDSPLLIRSMENLGLTDHQFEWIPDSVEWATTGPFDAGVLKEWFLSQQTTAVANGYAGIRVWLDLTRTLCTQTQIEPLLNWLETFSSQPIADVPLYCAYADNQIPPRTILQLLAAHRTLHFGNQLLINPYHGLTLSADSAPSAETVSRIISNLQGLISFTSNPRPEQPRPDAILRDAPYGIVTLGIDGSIRTANPKALTILGYTQETDLNSTLFIDLFSPEDRFEVSRVLSDPRSKSHTDLAVECKILRRDGISIPIELRVSQIELPEPDGAHLACYFHDITHHYEIEQALRASEQRYRFLVENQGEGVVMIDADGKIDYINAAGGNLLGGIPEFFIGQRITNFIPDSQMNHYRLQHGNRRKGVSTSFEIAVRSFDNIERDILVTATPRYSPGGNYNGTLAIFRDITERKQLEEKLRYQSTHDMMTGLFNRTYFDDAVELYDPLNALSTSIIIVDVDGLKEVNDQNGHKAGDLLIKKVAKILKASFRIDDVIARIGGDEFAILLHETDESQLRQAIIRLRRNLEEANANLPLEQQVSFSIGGATTSPTLDISQTLMLADMRMYRQKRRKKASHGSQLVE
ncbi:protein containg PAS domain S-box [Longilinea arvoryzae]|uniref:Protein containg PAS domain S-box n=1 Tax=Longilinea arvoryzae TaxID=360412 RepID=A0A0S7BB60_9CHLR|nr:diguanylate cyclase [Longilinea arvoryzae]GAP14814.1 protein containg PAS domain S-box [Longilinea arvoryzae]